MIGYLKGEVAAIYEDRIILEVGGIGYNVFMPAGSLDLIDGIGTQLKIHTYLLVREDALQLYGFLTRDDLELYRLLISVNGIGPKGGLAVLSVMTSDELRFAILAGDAKAIAKAPGIGPKTAQRVIIDLKDKIDITTAFDEPVPTVSSGKGCAKEMGSIREEAAEALIALGYSQTESYKAVRLTESDDDVESVLKEALSLISKF